MLILKKNQGQTSAEMILLIGVMLIIVLLVGIYVFNISKTINISLKRLLEIERNNTINKI